MMLLYDFLFLILFVISVSLFALYKMQSSGIREILKENKEQAEELKRIKSKLNRHEIQFVNMKKEGDKVEIVHRYDDSDAPDFPNSRR